MKHTLIFETEIGCSVETLFEFHSNTNNLPLITPPGISVEIIQVESPLNEGNIAVLKIKKGWLGFTWELVFEKVKSPILIVDKAVKSPFSHFRHEHHFIRLNSSRSVLRDVVEFSLPLEPLTTPAAWFVKQDMKRMFAHRHTVTCQLLE